MSTRPRILYVAPVEPWSRENGASVITADLLEGLARIEDVEIMPVFLRLPPPGYARSAPPSLEGVTLAVEGRPKWASVLLAALQGASPLDTRFDNRRVGDLVLQTVRARGFVPDVVHVEHLPLLRMGRRFARIFDVPLVYRAHNIESALWARRLGNGLGRGAVARRIARLEARAIAACDLTLCISDGDLEWVGQNAPGSRAELFPCSIDVERYDSVQPLYPSERPQICFVGGLEWGPNEVGLHWFVHEVLPRVVAEVPTAQLTVLARGAAERPWLTENPAIRILPGESDARALFASSRVSVAPLLQGGGVRIKIPESLSVGCPVVATRIGGEGLSLPGLQTTDDPAAFAEACVGHLRNPPPADLRTKLRAAVDERHGAGNLARRLAAIWTGLGDVVQTAAGLASSGREADIAVLPDMQGRSA